MDEDWRLQGQERYLCGATLHWRRWFQSRPDWDHDHCEFCGRKVSDALDQNDLVEAYASADGYYWVCADCANDFRERFTWTLVDH
jgi:hypothetical protein